MITRRGSDSRIMIPGDAVQVREYATVSFLPTDIAGLQTWLDFSDDTKLYTDAGKTTPVSSDGDVIGAAEDKSGQGNDATQSTTNLKPIYKTGIQNSLSVGRFDGVNDRLIATLASAYTIGDVFVVAKTAAVDAGYPLIIKNHDSGLGDGLSGAIVNSGFFKYENNIINFDWSGAWGVVRYEIASGTQEVYTNGVSRGTTTEAQTNSNTGVTVGNHQNSSNSWDGALNGDVAEIIIYNSALSTADRQSVETYLNNKWSIF